MQKLVNFLGLFSALCTVVFFAMLYGMHQGWDPSSYIQPRVAPVEKPNIQHPSISTSSLNITPTTITSSSLTASTTPKIGAPQGKQGGVQKYTTSGIKKLIAVKKIVTSPTPLLVEKSTSSISQASAMSVTSDTGNPNNTGALNQKRILEIVNIERAKENFPALIFSARLSAIAEGKAVDMINKQYFAHISPNGTDVAKLAEIYGYKYIYLGENLAMGDFVSSSDVMNGWMNSPGHRANILNKNYSEVGISAIQGNYQGRTVWYAVQEFGRPLSSCPAPDTLLEAKITTEEGTITTSEQVIATLRAEIDQSSSAGDQSAYNAKVERYNTLVDEYNALVATTKADINFYNASVSAFNVCIGVELKP